MMRRRSLNLFIALTLAFGVLIGLSAPVQAQHGQTEELNPRADLVVVPLYVVYYPATGQYTLRLNIHNWGTATSDPCQLQMLRHTGQYTTILGHQAEMCLITRVAVGSVAGHGDLVVEMNLGTIYPRFQWAELLVDCYNVVYEWSDTNNGNVYYF